MTPPPSPKVDAKSSLCRKETVIQTPLSDSSSLSLTRQVSHEALTTMMHSDGEKENEESSKVKNCPSPGRESPTCCVSGFDKPMVAQSSPRYSSAMDETAALACSTTTSPSVPTNNCTPPYVNPLHDSYSSFLSKHCESVRLEAELVPMRLILSRLIAHPRHNRKGVFNSPVDPVTLGLSDYFSIIKQPMDLGTVKVRLHALVYKSRRSVANDIRLVFRNAMKYNPPHNSVHISAKELLAFFEDQLLAFAPELTMTTPNDGSESLDKSTLPLPRALNASTLKAAPADSADSSSSTDNTASDRKTDCITPPPATEDMAIYPASLEKRPTIGAKSVFSASKGASNEKISRTVSSSFDQLTITGLASAASQEVVPRTTVNSFTCDPVRISAAATANNIHTVEPQGTRNSTPSSKFLSTPPIMPTRKRKKRGSRVNAGHSCHWCQGKICSICEQGCLPLEPALLTCSGPHCAGSRIRKAAVYHIAADGSSMYCQRCFLGLPAVLPSTGRDHPGSVSYKRDLLKRKNDEELVESWLECSSCHDSVHRVCAMHNEYASDPKQPYLCPHCVSKTQKKKKVDCGNVETMDVDEVDEVYTCVTGSEVPVHISTVRNSPTVSEEKVIASESLAEVATSRFIQSKVRQRMRDPSEPNIEKTVQVRIISDCHKDFEVPDVIRKHFRMATSDQNSDSIPPSRVAYRSKAIALFQKMDGFDVCIFIMYVHEYDGGDADCETGGEQSQSKRVYIAYLDSVEHFRPRRCRSEVFQEILVAYLATARVRGFEAAHIWACPPSRGNSFIFWNHPSSQRTPTHERLLSWYHDALCRAVDTGIVTDVQSLYDSHFQKHLNGIDNPANASSSQNSEKPMAGGRMLCPPLLEGDFWIEEAVRIHSISMARNLKCKAEEGNTRSVVANELERCPALQIANLLRERIVAHPSSLSFRKPVNAAALKLLDYHKIIENPMDLGTVYSHTVLGEYETLKDFVADVDLVFSNAKKYNPPGHYVHVKAIEVQECFFQELNQFVKTWPSPSHEPVQSWLDFQDMSMSLDMCLDIQTQKDGKSKEDPATVTAVTVENSGQPDRSDIREPKESKLTKSMAAVPPVAKGSQEDTIVEAAAPSRDNKPSLNLLTGGPKAILERMVGNDSWLLEKKNSVPPKGSGGKKAGVRRRKSKAICAHAGHDEQLQSKRRRQSWLGEEVGASVRKRRNFFFTCSLVPKLQPTKQEGLKVNAFMSYAHIFDKTGHDQLPPSTKQRVADARHGLLEFSQFRNLEFDTLRRAKYSTNILLYHLISPEAPGTVPTCSTCKGAIQNVRWHKIGRVVENRPSSISRRKSPFRKVPAKPFVAEELCSECHAKHAEHEQFIPLQVTLNT